MLAQSNHVLLNFCGLSTLIYISKFENYIHPFGSCHYGMKIEIQFSTRASGLLKSTAAFVAFWGRRL